MKRHKIFAALTALALAFPSTDLVGLAEEGKDTQTNTEMAYVAEVLPNYLTANELSGSEIWISEPFEVMNIVSETIAANAYLVYDCNNCLGFVEVVKINESFHSTFVRDECERLTQAYNNSEVIALYFDDETFCISVNEENKILPHKSIQKGYVLGKFVAPSFYDLNDDGVFDTYDAYLILMHYAAGGSDSTDNRLKAEKLSAADLNNDGEIDTADALLGLQFHALKGSGQNVTMKEFLAEYENTKGV